MYRCVRGICTGVLHIETPSKSHDGCRITNQSKAALQEGKGQSGKISAERKRSFHFSTMLLPCFSLSKRPSHIPEYWHISLYLVEFLQNGKCHSPFMISTPTEFRSYPNYLSNSYPLELASSLCLLNEWMRGILQKGFNNFQRLWQHRPSSTFPSSELFRTLEIYSFHPIVARAILSASFHREGFFFPFSSFLFSLLLLTVYQRF